MKQRFLWLDITRGLAIFWIFLVHFTERFQCCPMFANPSVNWHTWHERFSQLASLEIEGLKGFVLTSLRDIGWMGDQGVQIFLVASGFALTISALTKNKEFSVSRFYKKRMMSILPLWIAVHLLFMATYVLFHKGLSPGDWRTWASLSGLRFLPQVMYYRFPAWWYIGLLLQIYLVFPWLLTILRRWSPLRFLIVLAGIAILIRLAGLFFFDNYLDWWSRGGFFITRLPEFIFGMAFAKWLLLASAKSIKLLKSPTGVASVVGLYLLGNICSFFLPGMSVAFLLTGAGFFLLIFILFSNSHFKMIKLIAWAGKHSYSIYLLHHPVILFLLPKNLAPEAVGHVAIYFAVTFILSVILALSVERTVNFLIGINRNWFKNNGAGITVARWAMLTGLIISCVIGAEFLVRYAAPQEVLGWGERSSLEPHPVFGYHLKPNKVTRLRWLSYDYIVESNELGFPGPLYSRQKPKDTYRILVTGDAFESAEGVDTHDAWPRLLEKIIQEDTGVATEVFNFSITGWGPNQYAAAVSEYVPEYKPDLIIIGFFVNDFDDVKTSNENFRKSIGFKRPSQTSINSFIHLTHLRSLIKITKNRLREILKNEPNPSGRFFGFFRALEKNNLKQMTVNAELVEERLKEIREVAESTGSQLLIVLVPASSQVCAPDTLDYYPKGYNLDDSKRFDVDQPQRLAKKVCNDLAIPYVDLRDPLRRGADKLPCQPRNMHWTKNGHRIVADYVAKYLTAHYSIDQKKTKLTNDDPRLQNHK